MKRGPFVAFVLAVLPVTAHAQVAQDKAVADAFFNDGLKLLRSGKFSDACPKLAESERIDPAVGTALYLGDCYERIAKLASAQAMFQEAYDLARRRGDARASVAKDHHDRITPSTLTLALAPNARVDGLRITRDDTVISLVEVGVAVPIDGGAHTIVVMAPKKKPFRAQVDVPTKEGAAAFTIPKLEDEEVATATSSTPTFAPSAPPKRTQRLAGVVVFGVGAAGLVLGLLAGVVATLDWNASNSAENGCNSGSTACPTEHGVDLRASAQSWATVSTIGLVAGAVVVIAGAILYFTAPKAKSATAWISPTGLHF